jgi:hypothetical protein
MNNFHVLENIAVSDNGFLFLTTTGETFTLNELGRKIFKLLQQKISVEAVYAQLVDEYDVERKILEKDCGDFFAQLQSYGLIKPV